MNSQEELLANIASVRKNYIQTKSQLEEVLDILQEIKSNLRTQTLIVQTCILKSDTKELLKDITKQVERELTHLQRKLDDF